MCLFYRPTSSPVSIFDNFYTTLQILNPTKFHSFVIIGDFNVNFCNKDYYLFSYIDDILCTFSLTQVVSSHTHISPSGTSSPLDYVLLSDLQLLHDCDTIPALATSDMLITKTSGKYVKFLNKNIETIPTLQQGQYIASNDREKADMLNSFFC